MNPKKKILIIDDDERNIFALSAVLRARGYFCLTVSDAQQGIDLLLNGNDQIDLVLMDMMMPDVDGYEALRTMRQQDKLEKLPVVAVTAQAMVGDREKCLKAGANGYISKPVDVDELLEVLQNYLD